MIPGVEAIGLGLYIKDDKALIIADLHLGFEEDLRKKGVLVPRHQYKDIEKQIDSILKQVEVKKVILNGDVKHEFGAISSQEWRDVLKLFDYFLEKNIEIIVVKGNHDTILGPIARKRTVKEVKEYRTGDILIIHGDEEPEKTEKYIIMGHEHPAITLKDDAKSEKFKCYIKGSYKDSTLLVQPSFNPLTVGTDVAAHTFLSPLLTDVQNFDVYIVNDQTGEVLMFGKVKDL